MGLEEMVVGIVFVGCASGVLKSFAEAMGRRSGASGEVKRILEELRELRADVGALQQQKNRPSNGGSAPLTGDVASRLKTLEEEMASLRDTTTQFDMSFDAALDRLERRVERMDGSVAGEASIQPKVDEARSQVVGRR